MVHLYTPEFIYAEQSYRLEGFHRWSRHRGAVGGFVVAAPVVPDDECHQEVGLPSSRRSSRPRGWRRRRTTPCVPA
jgi:hypothetical protein